MCSAAHWRPGKLGVSTSDSWLQPRPSEMLPALLLASLCRGLQKSSAVLHHGSFFIPLPLQVSGQEAMHAERQRAATVFAAAADRGPAGGEDPGQRHPGRPPQGEGRPGAPPEPDGSVSRSRRPLSVLLLIPLSSSSLPVQVQSGDDGEPIV